MSSGAQTRKEKADSSGRKPCPRNNTRRVTNFHEATVRVRYAETDQLGVVYHSNFFVWFEVGRVELLRQIGFTYKDMEKQDDCHIVVVEVACRYLRPARYDDLLRVRTHVTEVRNRSMKFEYEVVQSETGELLATGSTSHVICDRKGKPKMLPEKYRKFFRAAERR